MKLAEEKIKRFLIGNDLTIYLNEKSEIKQRINLCENRLSLYYAGFCFMFGWFFYIVFMALSKADTSLGEVVIKGASEFDSSKIIYLLLPVFSCWGMIVDTIKLYKLRKEYNKFIGLWYSKTVNIFGK